MSSKEWDRIRVSGDGAPVPRNSLLWRNGKPIPGLISFELLLDEPHQPVRLVTTQYVVLEETLDPNDAARVLEMAGEAQDS